MKIAAKGPSLVTTVLQNSFRLIKQRTYLFTLRLLHLLLCSSPLSNDAIAHRALLNFLLKDVTHRRVWDRQANSSIIERRDKVDGHKILVRTATVLRAYTFAYAVWGTT